MRPLLARLLLSAALLPVLGGAGFVNLRFDGWRTFTIDGLGFEPQGVDIPPELESRIADFVNRPELFHFSLADAMEGLDIRPGDVVEAHIESFVVSASSDLGFLSAVEVWLVDGLSRDKLAARYAIPDGATEFRLALQGVDLTSALRAEDPVISVRVNGRPPAEDVKFRADYTLRFGVSAQGACGARRILKDYDPGDDTGGAGEL